MRQISAFEVYLRTGRTLLPAAVQTKFNPWHDPDDGRFTSRGQGRYFGRGSQPERRDSAPGFRGGGGSFGGGGAGGSWALNPTGNRPTLHPKGGSSGGGGASGAWHSKPERATAVRAPAVTRAEGVGIAVRAPAAADEPHITVRKSGYSFDLDAYARTIHAMGEIHLSSQSRSRSAQTNAGKPDRRATDDGGHYVAARFNGPRDWFNHFAQDANFNRGAYRALEDRWAKAVRSGKRVFVDIVPQYRGTSMRPYRLIVTSISEGKKRVEDFPNENQGR